MCSKTGSRPSRFLPIELREQRLAGVDGRALPARSSVRATTSSNPPQQRFAKIPYASAASTRSQSSEPDASEVVPLLAEQM